TRRSRGEAIDGSGAFFVSGGNCAGRLPEVPSQGDARRLVRCQGSRYRWSMRSFTAVIERDADTGLFVGYVPGWPGAHSQGATIDELRQNLEEVVAMLLEDGEPKLEGEFVGTQTVKVA